MEALHKSYREYQRGTAAPKRAPRPTQPERQRRRAPAPKSYRKVQISYKTVSYTHLAIYGAGSLGTVLGAYMSRAGQEVELVNHNQAHVEACLLYTSESKSSSMI